MEIFDDNFSNQGVEEEEDYNSRFKLKDALNELSELRKGDYENNFELKGFEQVQNYSRKFLSPVGSVIVEENNSHQDARDEKDKVIEGDKENQNDNIKGREKEHQSGSMRKRLAIGLDIDDTKGPIEGQKGLDVQNRDGTKHGSNQTNATRFCSNG